MANFKRRHPRRQVKCAMCTPHRLGNCSGDGGSKYKDRKAPLPDDVARLMKSKRGRAALGAEMAKPTLQRTFP